MLDEKTMVSDALAGVNGELVRYGEMISQTENKELKQKLKQIRNDCEMSQEKLYQIAREKSYYVPAAKATDQEISHVKTFLPEFPHISIERTRYRELATGNFSCILWYLKCTPGHFFCSGMQHFVAFLFIRLLYYTFLTASDII